MDYKKNILAQVKKTNESFLIWNDTDGISATDKKFNNIESAEAWVRETRKRFLDGQGYYKTSRGQRIHPYYVVYIIVKGKNFFKATPVKEVEFNEEEQKELQKPWSEPTFGKSNKKITISSREKEDFNPEFKLKFQNEFNANNLAKEIYALGYKTEKEILEQFKERNYEVNSDIKTIVKAIIENGGR